MISGLLIAAGKSSRMGECKAFLSYKNQPFIINILSKMELICSKIIIVAGYDAQKFIEKTRSFLNIETNNGKKISDKIKFIINYDYETGMFSSLQKGLSAFNNSRWVLYHFIDQPLLPGKFYSDFSKQIDDDYDWIQPVYENRKGHPVFINKRIFPQIINENSAHNLRDVFSKFQYKKKLWECSYPEIFCDIDTPEDYSNYLIKKI